MALIVGCTAGDTEEQLAAEKSLGPGERIDIQMQAAFEILKEEKEGFDEYQKVSLQKLGSRYFLAELLPEQARIFSGGLYYIVDTEKRVITDIAGGSGSANTLEIMELENNILTFLLHLQNGAKGRFFPSLYTYNLETGEQKKEPYYARLWDTFKIGGGQKQLGLMQVEIIEDAIVFRFEETENTFIAGGLYSPSIEISRPSGARDYFENDNLLAITFHDSSTSGTFDRSAMNIKDYPEVKDVHVSQYLDIYEINHVVVILEFPKEVCFNCDFRRSERESKYFDDLYLSLDEG